MYENDIWICDIGSRLGTELTWPPDLADGSFECHFETYEYRLFLFQMLKPHSQYFSRVASNHIYLYHNLFLKNEQLIGS